MLISPLGRDTM